MNHINELAIILNQYLKWNKARIGCLAQIVHGMIAVKSVNLVQIATSFHSNAECSSSYRRIQRFFKEFVFDPAIISRIVFAIFPMPKKFMIAIDRTNWKLGKTHFNFLTLSIVYKTIAIPVYWMNLAKGGNSHTDHRMYAVTKAIGFIGKHRIKCLLADREFIGAEWLEWLAKSGIHFAIRLRGNLLAKQASLDACPRPISSLFRHLKRERKKNLKDIYFLENLPVYLCASRSPSGELLIVASPKRDRYALARYKCRWEIENLFGCLKSRGFNLEDTHITDQLKVERLLFIVVIAFCWSYLIGIEKDKEKPIQVKSHGRRSCSIFRYGYDVLRKAVFEGPKALRILFRFLVPNHGGLHFV